MEKKLRAKVVVNNPLDDAKGSNYDGLKQFIRHKANSAHSSSHYNRNVIVAPSNNKTKIPVMKSERKSKKKKSSKQPTNSKQISSDTNLHHATKSSRLPELKGGDEIFGPAKNPSDNKQSISKYTKIWNNQVFHVSHYNTSEQQTLPMPENVLKVMNDETRASTIPYSSKIPSLVSEPRSKIANPTSILKTRIRSAEVSEKKSTNQLSSSHSEYNATTNNQRPYSTGTRRKKGVAYKDLNEYDVISENIGDKSKNSKTNIEPLENSIPLYPTRVRSVSTPESENTFGSTPEVDIGSQEEFEPTTRAHHKLLGTTRSNKDGKELAIGNSSNFQRKQLTNAGYRIQNRQFSKTNAGQVNEHSSRSMVPQIRSQYSKSKLKKQTSHRRPSQETQHIFRKSAESKFGSDVALNDKTQISNMEPSAHSTKYSPKNADRGVLPTKMSSFKSRHGIIHEGSASKKPPRHTKIKLSSSKLLSKISLPSFKRRPTPFPKYIPPPTYSSETEIKVSSVMSIPKEYSSNSDKFSQSSKNLESEAQIPDKPSHKVLERHTTNMREKTLISKRPSNYRYSVLSPSQHSRTNINKKTLLSKLKSMSKSRSQTIQETSLRNAHKKTLEGPVSNTESTFGFDLERELSNSEPSTGKNNSTMVRERINSQGPFQYSEPSKVPSPRSTIQKGILEPCKCPPIIRKTPISKDPPLTNQVNNREPSESIANGKSFVSKVPKPKISQSNRESYNYSISIGRKEPSPSRDRSQITNREPYEERNKSIKTFQANETTPKSSRSYIENTFGSEHEHTGFKGERTFKLNIPTSKSETNNLKNRTVTKERLRYRDRLESVYGSDAPKKKYKSNLTPSSSIIKVKGKSDIIASREPSVCSRRYVESTFGSNTALKSKTERSKVPTINDTNQINNERPSVHSTSNNNNQKYLQPSTRRRTSQRSWESCDCSIRSKTSLLPGVSRPSAIQELSEGTTNQENTFGSDAALTKSIGSSTNVNSGEPLPPNQGGITKASFPRDTSQLSNQGTCDCSISIKSKNGLLSNTSTFKSKEPSVRTRSNIESTFGSETSFKCACQKYNEEPCQYATKSRTTLISKASRGTNPTNNQRSFEYASTKSRISNGETCDCSIKDKQSSQISNRGTCSRSITSKNTVLSDASTFRKKNGYIATKEPSVRATSKVENTFGSDTALKYNSGKSYKEPRKGSNQVRNQGSCDCSTSIKSKRSMISDTRSNRFGYNANKEPSLGSKSNIESTFGSDTTSQKYNEDSFSYATKSRTTSTSIGSTPTGTSQASSRRTFDYASNKSRISNGDACDCSIRGNKMLTGAIEELSEPSRSNIESTFGSDTGLKYNANKGNIGKPLPYKPAKLEHSRSKFTKKRFCPTCCSGHFSSETSPNPSVDHRNVGRMPLVYQNSTSRERTFGSDAALKNKRQLSNSCDCSASANSRTLASSPRERSSPEFSSQISNRECAISIRSRKTLASNGPMVESTFGSDAALGSTNRSGKTLLSNGEPCDCSKSFISGESKQFTYEIIQEPSELSKSNIESTFGSDAALQSPTRSGKTLLSNGTVRRSELCDCSKSIISRESRPYAYEIIEEPSELSKSNIESTFGSDAALRPACDCSISNRSGKTLTSSRNTSQRSNRKSSDYSTRSGKTLLSKGRSSGEPCACSKSILSGETQGSRVSSHRNSGLASMLPQPLKSKQKTKRTLEEPSKPSKSKQYAYEIIEEPSELSKSNIESTFGSDAALGAVCDCGKSSGSGNSFSSTSRSTRQRSNRECECSTRSGKTLLSKGTTRSGEPCECSKSILNGSQASSHRAKSSLLPQPLKSRQKSNIESTFGSDAALGTACECSKSSRTSKPKSTRQMSIQESCECSTKSGKTFLSKATIRSGEPCECSKSILNGSQASSHRAKSSLLPQPLKSRQKSIIESTFGSDAALGTACECSKSSRTSKPKSTRQMSIQESCECSTKSGKTLLSRATTRSGEPCECSKSIVNGSQAPSHRDKAKSSLLPQPLKSRQKSNLESTFGSDAALGTGCECSKSSRTSKSKSTRQKSSQESCECSTKSGKTSLSKATTRSGEPCECSKSIINGSQASSHRGKTKSSLLPQPYQSRQKSNIESMFGSDAALGSACECSRSSRTSKSKSSHHKSNQKSCECSTKSGKTSLSKGTTRSGEPCECSKSVIYGSQASSHRDKARSSLLPQPLQSRQNGIKESTFGSDAALGTACECSKSSRTSKSKSIRQKSNQESCECSTKSGKTLLSKATTRSGEPCECSKSFINGSQASLHRDKARSSLLPQPSQARQKTSKISKSNVESTFGSDAALEARSKSIGRQKSSTPRSPRSEPCECGSTKSRHSQRSAASRSTARSRRSEPCECANTKSKYSTRSTASKSRRTSTDPKNIKKERASGIQKTSGRHSRYSSSKKGFINKISSFCKCKSSSKTLSGKEQEHTFGSDIDQSITPFSTRDTILSIPSPLSSPSQNASLLTRLKTKSKSDKTDPKGARESNKKPSRRNVENTFGSDSGLSRHTSQTSILKAHSKYDKKKKIIPTLSKSTSRLRIDDVPSMRSKSNSNEKPFSSKIPRRTSGSRHRTSKGSGREETRNKSRQTSVSNASRRGPCECAASNITVKGECECASNKSRKTIRSSKSSKGPCECSTSNKSRSTKREKSLTRSRSNIENTFGSDAALKSGVKSQESAICECGERARRKKVGPYEIKSKSDQSSFRSYISLGENTFGSNARINKSPSKSGSKKSKRSKKSRGRLKKTKSIGSIKSEKVTKKKPSKSRSRQKVSKKSSRSKHGSKHSRKSRRPHRSESTLIATKNLDTGSCMSRGTLAVGSTTVCTPKGGVCQGSGPQIIETPDGPVLFRKCDPGTCGTSPATECEIAYAHAVISKFKNYTIYQLTKQFRKKPWNMSKVTDGVFVVRCNK